MPDGTDPWTTLEAATQFYREGLLDADAYDAAVLGAFGWRHGAEVLAVAWLCLGD